MKRTRFFVGVVAAAVLAAGCEQYKEERGRGDAPVASRDDTAKAVIQFPDIFPNVAHACDGYGHRVFVPSRGNASSGRQVTVVEDPSCPGGGAR